MDIEKSDKKYIEIKEIILSKEYKTKPDIKTVISNKEEFGTIKTAALYDVYPKTINNWIKKYNKESLNINS